MSRHIVLSKLLLEPRSRRVHAELGAPYEMHRTLSRVITSRALSPEGEKEAIAEARLLFRVDGVNDAGQVVVLVQTRTTPNWSALAELDGYLAAPVACREVSLAIDAGTRLAFRLRANPTVKRDGKRRGLYTEGEQVAWLQRKGAQHGFQLQRVTPTCESRTQRTRRHDDMVEHLAVRFDGELSVTDASVFVDAVADGIGSAKGFGFGLLSLARVR